VIKTFKNVDLIIAHKKYHFLNKDKFIFKIDSKTNNLKDFCKKYLILYKNWKFLNEEKLKIDIQKYNNILVKEFLWKKRFLWRFKLWLKEKFLKF